MPFFQLKAIQTIVLLFLIGCQEDKSFGPSQNLADWLSKPVKQREDLTTLTFANEPLSKAASQEAKLQIYRDFEEQMNLKYQKQWESKVLQLGTLKMPFFYEIFGAKPSDGRSLFISLHGGGGVPAATNYQQYENQKHLYQKTMKSMEGVYLAPRAPTNTWNLWHESHIDTFLERLIAMAAIHLDVNPNKVYLLGYSAGGDGVYQLAPRMAYRWAAASMMAGHPNDASPINLRNTPFSLHMGGEDAAYDRNMIAAEWKGLLADLENDDPEAYNHEVVIHDGLGHWMELKDAIALPWMHQFIRNPYPTKVVWRQDDVHHEQFYWLKVPKDFIQTNGEIVVSYDRQANEVDIIENYSSELDLLLSDEMLDLDKPIVVKYKGEVIGSMEPIRTVTSLYQSLHQSLDENYAYSSVIKVLNNSGVE
jgi:predicted esterase